MSYASVMNDATTGMTSAEMTERSGVSIDTLRYYEREGLLSGVSRAPNGHRRDSEDAGWVDVLRCLRLTGMSIQQMKHFTALGDVGNDMAQERYGVLIGHRERVLSRIVELEEALAARGSRV